MSIMIIIDMMAEGRPLVQLNCII